MPVCTATAMDCPLNLNEGVSLWVGDFCWEREIGFAARAPSTIGQMSLACFIPALDKVMMDVNRSRSHDLDIHIMVLAFTIMSRSYHRMRIEINPAYKHRLRFSTRINQPTFLMLTVSRLGSIPADANGRNAFFQSNEMFGCSPESICFQGFRFRVGTPEDDAHIDT